MIAITCDRGREKKLTVFQTDHRLQNDRPKMAVLYDIIVEVFTPNPVIEDVGSSFLLKNRPHKPIATKIWDNANAETVLRGEASQEDQM